MIFIKPLELKFNGFIKSCFSNIYMEWDTISKELSSAVNTVKPMKMFRNSFSPQQAFRILPNWILRTRSNTKFPFSFFVKRNMSKSSLPQRAGLLLNLVYKIIIMLLHTGQPWIRRLTRCPWDSWIKRRKGKFSFAIFTSSLEEEEMAW